MARSEIMLQRTKRYKKMVLFPLIASIMLILGPALILQLYLSFNYYSIYSEGWWASEWYALDIFSEVLSDERFHAAIIRSLGFALASTVGCFVIGFGLALLMYKNFRLQWFYYIIFIIPMLTVPIVIAYTAEMILYQKGPLNGILSSIVGRDMLIMWITDPDIALFTVVLMEIWNWAPFSFIIMMAGLASLPKEPVEAAQILGASRIKIFFEIQLPLLRPIIVLALVLRFLEAMAEFPKTWAIFQGGPGTSTETIPVLIYLNTWYYFDWSKAAAMSYVVMLMMVVIILTAINILQRENKRIAQVQAN
jgi:multiple sugar transport system permease protein